MTTDVVTRTMVDAINSALRYEMEQDETVIVIGEDMAGGATIPGYEDEEAWGGVLGQTQGLVSRFGRDRVLDTPISESAFIGASIGAAMTGLRPVAELQFVDFMGVCLDQIFNQGAKLRYIQGGQGSGTPMVIRCMIGAGVRAAAQQSACHYSILTHFPGIKTVVPSTPADAKGLLISAIRDNDLVVYFEHKVLYDFEGEVPEGEYTVPLGKADIKRPGDTVTVVAIGRMVHTALEAAAALESDGIDVEVVDPRTLSPLDDETILESVAKTGRLVVVDEDNPRCSMAGDIVALAANQAFDSLQTAPQIVTAPHTPVPFAPVLEDFYIPSPQRVSQAIRAAM